MADRRNQYEYHYPFGEWLQDQLARLGIQDVQKEIAEAVGVSQATVSRWVSGTRRPNAQNLRALASVLGMPLDVVFSHAGYYGTVYRYRNPDAYLKALRDELAELKERELHIRQQIRTVEWEKENLNVGKPPADTNESD